MLISGNAATESGLPYIHRSDLVGDLRVADHAVRLRLGDAGGDVCGREECGARQQHHARPEGCDIEEPPLGHLLGHVSEGRGHVQMTSVLREGGLANF